MNNQFTIQVVTEHNLGLVAKILLVMNRKQLTVRNMNLAESKNNGDYQHSFLVEGNSRMIKNASSLINKLVGVFSTSTQDAEEIQNHEVAVFKVPVLADKKHHLTGVYMVNN